MNLKFIGLNLEVTEALKQHTTNKLKRIQHHLDHVISMTITFSAEKANKTVEANAHIAGKEVHVGCTDPDMYTAIDCLMDKLDRTIIKHKEKKQQLRTDQLNMEKIATDE